MPPVDTPFMITVCGLEELAGHADRQVSHVLSILDPDQAEPEAFGAYGEHARLELKFHDIIEKSPEFRAPQPEDVAKMLEFGQDILRDPESLRHLLVHCHMGISRSTAAMALLLTQAMPDAPASESWPILCASAIRHGRTSASSCSVKTTRPERRAIAAAAAIYRLQLERRPEIKTFFVGAGRGREIDIALNGAS